MFRKNSFVFFESEPDAVTLREFRIRHDPPQQIILSTARLLGSQSSISLDSGSAQSQLTSRLRSQPGLRSSCVFEYSFNDVASIIFNPGRIEASAITGGRGFLLFAPYYSHLEIGCHREAILHAILYFL